jgi:hypothetical protein
MRAHCALSFDLFSVASSAKEIGTGVAWVTQDAKDLAMIWFSPLIFSWGFSAAWKKKPLTTEMAQHTKPATHTPKCLE